MVNEMRAEFDVSVSAVEQSTFGSALMLRSPLSADGTNEFIETRFALRVGGCVWTFEARFVIDISVSALKPTDTSPLCLHRLCLLRRPSPGVGKRR